MPRDPYVREKYTREVKTTRAVARDYFERFPKDRYETAVESWRHLQCDNYEFTMKRLREPKHHDVRPVQDSGWVRERHSERPWDGDQACRWRAPGAPCPSCNAVNDGEAPRMPSGFKPEVAPFSEPIELPNGRKLVTLKDAATYITGLPKNELALPEWQTAIEVLMLCSRGGVLGVPRSGS